MITLSLVLVGCDNNIDESELVVRNDIHYQINSDKPFTGSVTSYHENGQKKNLGTYKKGLKDGLSEEFFSNGQLLSSVNYFMGGKEGVEKKYYENGNIQFVNNYKNSRLDGLKETYFDNGQLELKENYENGKLKETLVRYDESGNEILILSFSRDDDSNFILLSDSEVVIRIGGNIIREGKVEGDEIWEYLRKSNEEPFNGLIVTYHDNGQLELKENYENGKLKETIVRYDESGNEILILSFSRDDDSNFILLSDSEVVIRIGGNIIKEGKVEGDEIWESLRKSNEEPFNGLLVSYHDNGNPNFRGLVKNGLDNGVWEFFTENGQLQSKETYKDGKIHGLYELWFDDGEKLEEFYKDGERHGLKKYVRSDGSIWGEECYQNGEKVDLTVCELK